MDYGSAVLLVRFHNQCDDDTYTHTHTRTIVIARTARELLVTSGLRGFNQIARELRRCLQRPSKP